MKRGAYTFDKTMELKFRGSPNLYNTIKTLAERKETTMAAVMREMVEQRIKQENIQNEDVFQA